MDAKSVSKRYAALTRQDWDVVKFRTMRWCLEVKLIQNFSTFSELLLSTGDKPIVEYSTKDSLWGAIPQSKEKLVGVNALGRLLMELRGKVETSALVPTSVIYPLDIPAFLLFNNRISEVHNDDYFIHDLDEIHAC